MSKSNIAERIRSLRLSRGWSQEALARASGISKRTIERAETGKPVSHFTLSEIASAFEMTLPEFQSGNDEANETIRITLTVDVPASNPKKASRIISSVLENLSANDREMLISALPAT